MFGFGGVFGRKPRRFDYIPRYYDAEQEAREQRKREVLGPDYADKYKSQEELAEQRERYVPGTFIRKNMIERRGIQRSPRNNAVAVRRLIIIFALLLIAAVWLMSTDSINTFFEKWLAR